RVGELPNLSLGSVQELMVTVSEFLSIDEATELILDNTSLVKYSATLKKVVATFGEFGWLESLPELLRSSFEDLVRLNPELLREFLQDLKRKFPGEARAYLLTKNIPVLSRA